jgi:hypothetical protein
METINAELSACWPSCIHLCDSLCLANGSDTYWTNDMIVWDHYFWSPV